MRVGDVVRDRAQLRGTVQAIRPGRVCMVRVEWASGDTSWIKARWLRTSPIAEIEVLASESPHGGTQAIDAVRSDLRKL